jgi:hypothetical protein
LLVAREGVNSELCGEYPFMIVHHKFLHQFQIIRSRTRRRRVPCIEESLSSSRVGLHNKHRLSHTHVRKRGREGRERQREIEKERGREGEGQRERENARKRVRE